MKKAMILISIFLFTLSLTACGNPEKRTGSSLTIPPRTVIAPTAEEKKNLLDQLEAATQKENYAAFAVILADIYAKGWQSDNEIMKAESKLYVKGTEYFDQGLTDQAYKMASAIYPKVYESWRFKFLKIRCLERYGLKAFDSGDLVKAQDYAHQITSIEFRPEGVNLQAKIYIKQAEDALKKGDKEKAKSILMQSSGMEISEELRKKIDDMFKTL